MSQDGSRWRGWSRWATGLIAVVGVVVAWYLTDLHVQAVVGDSIGGSLCGGEGRLDCESALHSDYAELFGIPISLLGVSFYLAVAVLAVFDRVDIRNSSQPFRPGAVAAVAFGGGVLFSIYLAAVSAVDLGTFCPFCAMLYGVNVVGFVVASIWAGESPHRIVKAQIREPKAFFNGWTGLFAMALGVALIGGTWMVDTEIDRRVTDPRQDRQMASDGEVDDQPGHIDPADYRSRKSPAKGADGAPVHIVEFSSFTCPHCGRLADVLERLVDEHGERVRVEYRYFPTGPGDTAHRAARAGVCADEQGAFWEMADLLYENTGRPGADGFVEYAGQIDLDEERFQECLDSDQTRRRVDRDVEAGERLGIRGTPTFFVNGQRLQGAVPYEELEEIVVE